MVNIIIRWLKLAPACACVWFGVCVAKPTFNALETWFWEKTFCLDVSLQNRLCCQTPIKVEAMYSCFSVGCFHVQPLLRIEFPILSSDNYCWFYFAFFLITFFFMNSIMHLANKGGSCIRKIKMDLFASIFL